MTGRADERFLNEDDPLRDGAPVATRLLAIDEAERIRDALRDGDIASRLRLVKPVATSGGRHNPVLESPYSVIRPSWNVIVAPPDLARARAVVEERLGVDVDGRDDTAVALGEPPPPQTAALVRLPWHDAWAVVERLGTAGIHAAAGNPSGHGPIEEQEVSVLVKAEDLARARAVLPSPGPGA
jgi:hypothetical protein